MSSSIPIWQTGGFLFVSLLGTFLHFLFDLFGGNAGAALFSAVNESIWEHMKLIYIPMLIFAWIEYFLWGKAVPSFWCIKLTGLLTALLLIPVVYYTYTGILGTDADWFNIAIFFLAAGVALYLETRLFQTERTCRLPDRVALGGILLIGLLFLIFTFQPPRIPLFRDPITQSYGYRRTK